MSRSAEAISKNIKGLLPKQIKVIKKYDEDNKINNLSIETRENKINELVVFARFVHKPFDEVTEEDIKDYFLARSNLKPSSQMVKKSIIKSFFKW